MSQHVGYESEKISDLAKMIMRHKRLYYSGKPEISDADFDQLENQLKKLAPNHPALSFVGSDQEVSTRKAEHASPMLSLDKTYDLKDLESWIGGRAVVGMYKVDGASLSLIYENGLLNLAKTRGNGRVGEIVSEKARWVADIIPEIKFKGKVEIRGELYCTEDHFVLLSEELASLGLERPTSPRNIVAGFLGRKTHYNLAHYFNFFAFDALLLDAGTDTDTDLRFKTETEKFAWLKEMGFRLPEPEHLETMPQVEKYLEKVRAAIGECDYGLDGAVFSYDDLQLHEELGFTAHHPRSKLSFKWQGQTATATVKNVDWTTSRLGYVTPVAVIEPVFLSNAKITNITLHNAAHVKAFNLKAGDQIEIVRSGEVIPKFLQVIKSMPGQYVWPKKCPECDGPLEFDDVRLRCVNIEGCPAQKMRSILNWIRCVDIDDVSEKRLEQLMESGLLKTIPDLYRISIEQFLTLPMTKEKMATKLFKHIQASKSISLARFLNGLGIESAGLTTWEKLLEEFPSLEKIQAMSEADIVGISGFAEKSASQIVEGLKRKRKLIGELLKVGVQPKPPTPRSTTGKLVGKTFVITGALSMPRPKIEILIKAAGGQTSSSVSKNTFALVTNEPDTGSSKMKKAKELDVQIMTEAQLMKLLE